MPNFQSAANEVFNQVGLYSALAGGPQDLKETIKLGKEEKVLNKQIDNAAADVGESMYLAQKAKASGDSATIEELTKKAKGQNEELSRLLKNSLDIQERKYQLNPSQKNYEAVMAARRAGESSLEERQEMAMKKTSEQAEAKKKQRRNFKTYLAQQPTSLGGTVGDLSPDLQKKIASEYSRSDRKRMMDQMDREAKDGKQK